jgi:type 1 glutamine amidotransferase
MKNVENVLETIKEAIKECVNDNRNDSAVYVLSDGTVKMHCGSNNLDYKAMDAIFVAEINAWDEDEDFEYEAEEYYDQIDSEIDWDAIEEFLNR